MNSGHRPLGPDHVCRSTSVLPRRDKVVAVCRELHLAKLAALAAEIVSRLVFAHQNQMSTKLGREFALVSDVRFCFQAASNSCSRNR